MIQFDPAQKDRRSGSLATLLQMGVAGKSMSCQNWELMEMVNGDMKSAG
jgi:hypothetical protein